ncbi:hypothetical protein LRS74_15715 [Streptomyces sp. LX-29]|uniref:hypothetical protein n=1 Tax=Streptomyces sp. LX-29 TaxID=2900152 RepID=UPI00240DE0E3|nr:hypothetical protein [Streptomyces sp. LX-29]WFB08339.1 hypothetical protein LRS74_15715 [Streptomyces sp. LX-29]
MQIRILGSRFSKMILEKSGRSQEVHTPIWDSPRELGNPLASVGNTPVAVLGGFALTAMVNAATRKGSAWRDVSLLLFGVAVASFIVALLLMTVVAQYQATPEQRLGWKPEAKYIPSLLEEERRLQREDEWMVDVYSWRISLATAIGIFSTLSGGVAFLLFTQVTWGVLAAACVLLLAIIVVILQNLDVAPHWLFPKVARARPVQFAELTKKQKGMLK